MCNLYSITRSQEAMRRLFRVKRDLTGNLPSLPAIFPDTSNRPAACRDARACHQRSGTSEVSPLKKTRMGGTRGLVARHSSSARSLKAASSSSAPRWQTNPPGPFANVASTSRPSGPTKTMHRVSVGPRRSLAASSRTASRRLKFSCLLQRSYNASRWTISRLSV
jgi:hypothetical protein